MENFWQFDEFKFIDRAEQQFWTNFITRTTRMNTFQETFSHFVSDVFFKKFFSTPFTGVHGRCQTAAFDRRRLKWTRVLLQDSCYKSHHKLQVALLTLAVGWNLLGHRLRSVEFGRKSIGVGRSLLRSVEAGNRLGSVAVCCRWNASNLLIKNCRADFEHFAVDPHDSNLFHSLLNSP